MYCCACLLQFGTAYVILGTRLFYLPMLFMFMLGGLAQISVNCLTCWDVILCIVSCHVYLPILHGRYDNKQVEALCCCAAQRAKARTATAAGANVNEP
jgi:hypothetical protein